MVSDVAGWVIHCISSLPLSSGELPDDIIKLTDQYGRYRYGMVNGLLKNAGWCVSLNRGRREGQKVPQKRKRKGRLWPHDGLCVRI